MPPTMMTRHAGRPASASRGRGTGGQAGRGGGGQGSEVNGGVGGVPDFSTILHSSCRIGIRVFRGDPTSSPTILLQVDLAELLPPIVAQVGFSRSWNSENSLHTGNESSCIECPEEDL
ncbi:hypothetical protein Tco_0501822 [Tanacetum coccineum]